MAVPMPVAGIPGWDSANKMILCLQNA